ncbi:hypothetical protein NBG4_990001 [Candidatus Sulfobium mesophilum]|uniref:Magnesium chelatase ChlI-like catalytic domain-containing protein n=1 Tax=Candidatus Sulfobium mesophilum TaxID=2016548 RepID=A0A2U3QLB3_9BACT|nr:hypothetical protein NBG4_990001 [Candidatus Sulfobium mesophilum]
MLSKRLATILPQMNFDEALETTRIHSIAGLLKDDQPLPATRPFRAPHHTISDVALIGGGQIPKPGEVSLAHNGVPFLDEIPEFKRNVLEVLRQPLENGEVTVSRAVEKARMTQYSQKKKYIFLGEQLMTWFNTAKGRDMSQKISSMI